MGSSRFWLKAADEESKSIPHEFPRSHWLKATGQWVLERYLSATMYSTNINDAEKRALVIVKHGYKLTKKGFIRTFITGILKVH